MKKGSQILFHWEIICHKQLNEGSYNKITKFLEKSRVTFAKISMSKTDVKPTQPAEREMLKACGGTWICSYE